MFIFLFSVAAVLILAVASMSDRARYEREALAAELQDAQMANRFPSGRITVQEMEAENIHPYFCGNEHKMVWVADPAAEESCPWCGGALISFS